MPCATTSNVCDTPGSYYNFSPLDHGCTTPFNLQFPCSLNPLPPQVTPPISGDCHIDPTPTTTTPSSLICLPKKFSVTSHHLQVRPHITSSSSSSTRTRCCPRCRRFRERWCYGFHHRWVELGGSAMVARMG